MCLLVLTGCVADPTTGSSTQSASAVATAQPRPAQGDFEGQINVGERRSLYLRCAGQGHTTVLLESGIHDSSDTWTISATDTRPVFDEVATYTHVCMYDRPGTIRYEDPPTLTTRSSPVEQPRTLQSQASDLKALVAAAGIPGPYLLVGHSWGGMIVRLFAQEHPADTAGIVFVDAFAPDIRSLFGAKWEAYTRVLNYPGTELDSEPEWETVDADGAIDAVRDANPLPAVPAIVLSKTEPFGTSPTVPEALIRKLEDAWPRTQRSLVELGPNTPHILATGSDHYVQLNEPDLVSSAIRLTLERIIGSHAPSS